MLKTGQLKTTQFGLARLFLLIAFAATFCGIGVWWHSTRDQRALRQKIKADPSLSSTQRKLFLALCRDKEYSQLSASLGIARSRNEWFLPATLVWDSAYSDTSGKKHHVFVFSATYVRPYVTHVVIADQKCRPIASCHAGCKGRLESAFIQTHGGNCTLNVVAHTLGLHSPSQSIGRYRYQLATPIRPVPVEWLPAPSIDWPEATPIPASDSHQVAPTSQHNNVMNASRI